MKTSKLITAILFVASLSTSALANGEESSAAKNKVLSIENQLSRRLTAPHFIKEVMGSHRAAVQFHINNDFSLVVEKITATDPRLLAWVQRELEKQKILTDRENIGRSYIIRLRFN